MRLTKKQELKIISILELNPSESFTRLEIDYNTLKALRLLGLVDGNDTHNESPSVDAFLGFCEFNETSEEEVIFEAYACINRDDARVSVEGIRLHVALSSSDAKKNFINEFRQADEFECHESNYRAWWD